MKWNHGMHYQSEFIYKHVYSYNKYLVEYFYIIFL